MRIGQGVRTGLGHGGITCVLQTQFSGLSMFYRRLSGTIHSCTLLAKSLPVCPLLSWKKGWSGGAIDGPG